MEPCFSLFLPSFFFFLPCLGKELEERERDKPREGPKEREVAGEREGVVAGSEGRKREREGVVAGNFGVKIEKLKVIYTSLK